jgi:hypothetical protein
MKWLVPMLLGWLGCAHPAHAELFENAYLSFRLPDGWACRREVTEWVCYPSTPGKKKPATVIMTAKYKGPGDTLSAYIEHLDGLAKDNPNIETTMSPRQRTIRGIVWIDGIFLNAQVKNYYTRYMATVSSGIAVLYTFSFHKSAYATYYPDSDFAVANLRLKPLKETRK